jgi:hypothetical protein
VQHAAKAAQWGPLDDKHRAANVAWKEAHKEFMEASCAFSDALG